MTLPSKVELLQGGIVTVDQQHKKVITNTIQLADYFGKRPSNVNQRIASLIKRGWLKIKPSYYLNQQEKQQKYYELNHEQFLLVVMGFTGDKAEQFKADFIALFNQQKAELLQWRTGRIIASDSTKLANDNIHWLKLELEKLIPESNRCKMLFVHVQQAINKVATGSAKVEDRNKLLTCQLYRIKQLELAVHAEIERLKADDIAPEQIRDDVLVMIKTAKEKAPTSDETERSLDDAAA